MNDLFIDSPDLLRDAIATVLTFSVSLMWLALVNSAASRGWLHPTLSRKVIHIGTGPLFVLTWPLFSHAGYARYLAALVPFTLTLIFLATGLRWIENSDLVKSSTRSGVPSELLRGPLYYGIVFVVCTTIFWRESPVGILALMMMCGGDGFADIVGRRFGTQKLPFSSQKSWIGSLAMFLGSMVFGFGYLSLFTELGFIQFSLTISSVFWRTMAIALVATVVEALPFPDIDNVTLTLAVITLSLWMLL